jgi:small subunit ribosomal protein S17
LLCAVQGKVVSVKAQKTVSVAVERLVPHPLYLKRQRSTKKYQVHDEEGLAQLGDYVEIEPCQPISKTKRFKLGSIIQKSAGD